MPNWCSNTLNVFSDMPASSQKSLINLLDKFYEENRDEKTETELSFNKKVPEVPDNDDWYNWRFTNWGTKWDITCDLFDLDPEGLSYAFDTAWSPPEAWLLTVSKEYPTLQFELTYYELGMDFGGRMTVQNGEVVDGEDGVALDFCPDDTREMILADQRADEEEVSGP